MKCKHALTSGSHHLIAHILSSLVASLRVLLHA